MKKAKKYFLYAILLILAIFNLNTVMNILVYNSMLNAIVEHKVEIHYSEGFKFLLPCLIILFNFLISYIFAKWISKIENKHLEIENEDDLKSNRKEHKIFSIIYGLSFIGFNIIFYLNYIKNLSIITEKFLDYSIWDLSESFISYATPEINLLIICLNCLVLIPAIISLLSSKKQKKLSKFKFIKTFVSSIFIFILLACNMYFYIDIPEFKFAYYTYPTKELREDIKEELGIDEECVELLGFSDYMRNFKEEAIMTDQILGKNVFSLAGFPDNNIYISGNISWDMVKFIMTDRYPAINRKYVLQGESKEWIVQNNQLFNIDKTEMIIREPKKIDHLYIPATVEKVWNVTHILTQDKNVVVEEGNKYFYSHDGNLCFHSNENSYLANTSLFSTIEDEEKTNNSGECCTFYFVPKNKETIKLKEDDEGLIAIFSLNDVDVTIPATLVNEIYIDGSIRNIVIEENNPVYTFIDDCLYYKEMTKLIQFNKGDKKEYEIPASLQEFDIRTLASIFNSKIVLSVDENNQYFAYENNILYNKDKTKVIFTKINKGEYNYNTSSHDYYTELLDDNIEIDNMFKWYCNENNIEIKYKKEVDETPEIRRFKYEE